MTRRKNPDGPTRRHLALSAAVHLSAIALAWTTTILRPEPLEYITYEIELVSPPPAPAEEPQEEEPAPQEELVVERPDPEPEPVVEETPAPPDPEMTEAPVEEETREEPPPEPVEAAAAAAPDTETETEESGEDINVRMEGLRRDYPAYYDNIIRQMSRCFRWRGTGEFEAVVRFVIGPDGTVSGASLVQRSGNAEFDFEALGAVECAGRPGRLGPLPEDLPWDELPIQFSFRPQGRD